MRTKYTKEILEKAVKDSKYLSDMVRKMGFNYDKSKIRYLGKKIKEFKIDTSHWLIGSDKVKFARNSSTKIKKRDILSLCIRPQGAAHLRKALIEYGIEYKCLWCGIGEVWNNKKLVIQIDHINGNNLDNRIDNLRFLCPNCHSQTDTFSSKNRKDKKDKIKKKYSCIKCNVNVWVKNTRCKKCFYDSVTNKLKPTKEELEVLIKKYPIIKIAKQFNVSDNSINNWIKQYNIKKMPRGYWIKNSNKLYSY